MPGVIGAAHAYNSLTNYYDLFYVLGILWTLVLWGMMIALPRRDFTQRLLRSPLVLAPHLFLYALLSLPSYTSRIQEIFNPKDSTTIPHLLLGTEAYDLTMTGPLHWGLLGFNLHLLTLNLFVGRWMYWDGRTKLSPLMHSLSLFLTMCSGPLGLAFYLAATTLVEQKPEIKHAVRRAEDALERTGARIEGAVEATRLKAL